MQNKKKNKQNHMKKKKKHFKNKQIENKMNNKK